MGSEIGYDEANTNLRCDRLEMELVRHHNTFQNPSASDKFFELLYGHEGQIGGCVSGRLRGCVKGCASKVD